MPPPIKCKLCGHTQSAFKMVGMGQRRMKRIKFNGERMLACDECLNTAMKVKTLKWIASRRIEIVTE